jgi:pilus assembly protein FimV
MLQGSADEPDEQKAETSAGDSADEDLDSLLASFDPENDVSSAVAPARTGEQVEEELTANISHDLEMDLDSEVDELLNSTDDEIALEEQRNDEAVDVLDKMNLLSGTDETETKLDLARAYMEMDDKDGARDILNEITSEGSDEQRQEAQKLLDSL